MEAASPTTTTLHEDLKLRDIMSFCLVSLSFLLRLYTFFYFLLCLPLEEEEEDRKQEDLESLI